MKTKPLSFATPCKPVALITAFAVLFLVSGSVLAQRSSGDVGIGVHIGQPTGISLKFYNPRTSVDLLAAWDLDDFFFLNVHGIWDENLNDAHTIHFYYGPGAYIGLRDRGNDRDDDVAVGVSGAFGLDFLIRKFEIFLQLTPRLELIEKTDFDLGGGVGFRFYL